MTTPTPPLRTRYPWSGWDVAIVLLCAGYFLTWWNRSLAPSIGGGAEVFVGREFAEGRLPYRDYFFPLPPAYALASAAVVAVAGPKLIVFWFLGLVTRLVAMAVLYRWLLRVGPPAVAAFATLTVAVASSGDNADQISWYNFYAHSLAVVTGFAMTRRIEAATGTGFLWLAAAGVGLGCGLLVKQTTGVIVGAAAVSAFVFATLKTHGYRQAIGDLLVLGILAAVPVLMVFGWLWQSGAMEAFIDQVYLKGPGSKGGLAASLLRPVGLTLEHPALRPAAALALGILAVVALARQTRHKTEPPVLLIVAAALVAGYTVWAWREGGSDPRLPAVTALYTGLLGSAWITGQAFWDALFTPPTPRLMARGLIGAIGFSAAVGMSLSWPAFYPTMIPAFALCLVLVWNLDAAPGVRGRLRLAAAGWCVYLIVATAAQKWIMPTFWGQWFEPPVWTATVEPTAPELAGFRLSPQTAAFYDRLTEVLRERTSPTDRVFAFPHMPILYSLTDRRPATFCLMHWMDICPDYIATADAERLRADPPQMMLLMDLPNPHYELSEHTYRAGQRSGQRDLLAVIAELLPGYEAVETVQFGHPGLACPVTIWVRKRG